jgi:hypothetical protein
MGPVLEIDPGDPLRILKTCHKMLLKMFLWGSLPPPENPQAFSWPVNVFAFISPDFFDNEQGKRQENYFV